MQKKILVNGLTIEHGNVVPLLLKIKKWQKNGCVVTIIANKFLKQRIEDLQIISKCNYILIHNDKSFNNKLGFIIEAFRRIMMGVVMIPRIKHLNFDVIYTISSVSDLIVFAYIYKKFDKRIRWLTVFDNVVPLSDPGNKIVRLLAWLFYRVSILLLKNADVIFTISEENKNTLCKNGLDKHKIVITGNGIEEDLIVKSKPDKRYHFDAIYTGRINETKGIYDMLNVITILKKHYPSFKLGIIGSGDLSTVSEYKNKIRKLKLQNNIEFLGYLDRQEKFNVIKSSKTFLFLSFSDHESFGIALLEAVCCGIPAFSYDLKPFKLLYKNNEVIMTKKRDWREVARKMLLTFRSGNFRNNNGEKLLGKYSWDNIANKESEYFFTNK